MARRGSYAKGIAKREEILERALDVIATEGYSGASVKRIADAVGLSQAGLLHYFDSKEELFLEILRVRDQRDRAQFGPFTGTEEVNSADLREGFVRVTRHNTEVPGLVELFTRQAADAADPSHPAHRFFLERGAAFREAFVASAPRPAAPLSAETFARIMQAVSDGLQLQWLLDPSVDMPGIIDELFAALSGEHPDSPADER